MLKFPVPNTSFGLWIRLLYVYLWILIGSLVKYVLSALFSSASLMLMFSRVLILLNQFPVCHICILHDIVLFHASSRCRHHLANTSKKNLEKSGTEHRYEVCISEKLFAKYTYRTLFCSLLLTFFSYFLCFSSRLSHKRCYIMFSYIHMFAIDLLDCILLFLLKFIFFNSVYIGCSFWIWKSFLVTQDLRSYPTLTDFS